jgi:hypothetical protein
MNQKCSLDRLSTQSIASSQGEAEVGIFPKIYREYDLTVKFIDSEPVENASTSHRARFHSM